MSRIFLSHSSRDDAAAVAIGLWLKEEGWDDVFLDLDPSQGIHPGERWEKALYTHASDCEAVLFLVSRAWLASEWCRREYDLTFKLNKRAFVVLIEDIALDTLPVFLSTTHQVVRLASGTDHRIFTVVMPVTHEQAIVTFSREGLARLKNGLTRAGLDPRFFDWPPAAEPDRAPYRGLDPLVEADAGIFFGRDASIIEGLDMLRGLRAAAAPRLFVILGASGTGKSSFLRAGLLPRLPRDERGFACLPVIRPERAAISGTEGLISAITQAAAQREMPFSRAQAREAVDKGTDALRPLLRDLATRPDAEPATLVIAIDQAEELFRGDSGAEAERLLQLLRDLAEHDDPAAIVIFAIRSDTYDALEHARALADMSQRAFPLLPMPRGAYQTVIEGPARRLAQSGRKFEIEPALTRELLAQIETDGGSDALPLLAFTLEQLYRDYGGAGRLTRENFTQYGGLKGAIDAAVERVFVVADTDPRIPREREARLALLRRGLIPWMAGVDPESHSMRRRKARASQIPEEARPLIDILVEQRLLTRDVDRETGENMIEPAHEALLRQWGSLRDWLAEDFGLLAALEGIKRASRDWDANARAADWLAHGGARLAESGLLDARPDLAALLESTDRAYLASCQEKEQAHLAAETSRLRAEARGARNARRIAWVSTIGALVAIVLAALAAGAALYGRQQASIAREQRGIAERNAAAERESRVAAQTSQAAERKSRVAAQAAQAQFLGKASREALAAGDTEQAILLALEGLPDETHGRDLAITPNALAALDLALAAPYPRLTLGMNDRPLAYALFSPDGTRIATASRANSAQVRNAETGEIVFNLTGHTGGVTAVAFSPDGSMLATGSDDKTVRLWDMGDGHLLRTLTGHTVTLNSVAFSPDGTRLVTTSNDMSVRIWNVADGKQLANVSVGNSWVNDARYSPDGKRILIAAGDVAYEIDATTRKRVHTFETGTAVGTAAYSPDGKRVATAQWDGSAGLWDETTEKRIAVMNGTNGLLWTALFSPDGARLITAAYDGTARVWDTRNGAPIAVLKGPPGYVYSAAFSPNGREVVTSDFDGTAQVWDVAELRDMQAIPEFGYIGVNGGEGQVTTAFTRDGSRIATVLPDSAERATLVELSTGRALRNFKGHEKRISAATFSRDGALLLTGSWDQTARLWNTETGQTVATYSGHAGEVTSVAFSPDESLVATADWDGTARLWATRSAEARAVLRHKPESTVYSVAFRGDGNVAITAGSDGTVRTWRVSDGAALLNLAHPGPVYAALFLPDGKTIVTACDDGWVRLWDSETGRMSQSLPPEDAEHVALAVTADEEGRMIAVTYAAKPWDVQTSRRSVRVWDIARPEQLTVLAETNELVWYQAPAFLPGSHILRYVSRQNSIVTRHIPATIATSRDRILYGQAVSARMLRADERAAAFLLPPAAPATSAVPATSAAPAPATSAVPAVPAVPAAEPGPVELCDRLAASPSDPRAEAPGVAQERLGGEALDACGKAVEAMPTEPRLQFQLARALLQANRDDEAYKLFTRAAEANYPAAVNSIGFMLGGGRGVKQDLDAAIVYFRRAAALGVPIAYGNLAWAFSSDAKHDMVAAANWLEQGVATGACPSCDYNLALLLAHGDADARLAADPERSVLLFTHAVRGYEATGDGSQAVTARVQRALLARSMTPEAVAAAMRKGL